MQLLYTCSGKMQYAALYGILFFNNDAQQLSVRAWPNFKTPTHSPGLLNSCHESPLQAITAIIEQNTNEGRKDGSIKYILDQTEASQIYTHRLGTCRKQGSIIKMAGWKTNRIFRFVSQPKHMCFGLDSTRSREARTPASMFYHFSPPLGVYQPEDWPSIAHRPCSICSLFDLSKAEPKNKQLYHRRVLHTRERQRDTKQTNKCASPNEEFWAA